MENKFVCPICDADNWSDLDYLRSSKVGFCICKECGFQTYHPSLRKYQTEESLLDFYRYEYRRHPNAENLITCNRKVGYIMNYFQDFFNDKKHYKVLDIGSATGYFLAHLKSMGFSIENLYGSEYTTTFKNFSKNFYGLKHIYDEIPKDVKFNLIHLCHVLEHIHEPDKKLEYYREILEDDGYLSVWVPVWHNCLIDTAKRRIENFEDYYHINHINTWTERGLLNLFNKTGWKVIKQDHRFYGFAVLLQKGDKTSIFKEDYKEIIDSTIRQKDAVALHLRLVPENKKALEKFPKYPDAISGLAFYDNKSDYKAQLEIINNAIRIMPEVLDLKLYLANTYWQWKEYQKSLEICVEYARLRSNDDVVYELMAKNFIEMGEIPNAVGALNKSAQLNPSRWYSVQDIIGNLMGRDWSKPPIRTISPVGKDNKANRQ